MRWAFIPGLLLLAACGQPSHAQSTARGPVAVATTRAAAGGGGCTNVIQDGFIESLTTTADPAFVSRVISPCVDTFVRVDRSLADGAEVSELREALGAWVDVLVALDDDFDVDAVDNGLEQPVIVEAESRLAVLLAAE